MEEFCDIEPMAAAKLTDYWTVNREYLGTSLSRFGSEHCGTFYSFHGQVLSKNIARTARRHSPDDICYLEYILKTWTAVYLLNFPINMHYRDELNIDGGNHVFACFKTKNYFEWIIKHLK